MQSYSESATLNTFTGYSTSSIKDYIALMKPRVMVLVIFTSFCGMLHAKNTIHPFLGFTALLFISMGAGAAGVINMWYDRDIDKIMKRTQNRPLVRGAIEPNEALSFGIILGFFAIFLSAFCINFLTAILLSFTIFYYIFIYTIWLKRTDSQNVVIGGIAGALPPVIGMAAVDNNISIEAVCLMSIIFLWTPPHSWAFTLYKIDDYKSCNIPMLPLTHGITYTNYSIMIYTSLMIIASLLPFFLGMAGKFYLILALILGTGFLYYDLRLFKKNTLHNSKRLFIYSIFYLFMIFLSLGVEPIVTYIN